MSATQVRDHQVGDHHDVIRCVAGAGKDRHALARWTAGAAAAILAHGVAAAMLLRLPAEPVTLAPTATIVIELSPVVAAPVVLPAQTPPVPDLVEAETPSQRVIDKTIEAPREVVEDEPEPEIMEPELEPRPETTPPRPRPAPREDDAPNLEGPSPPLPAQEAAVELAPTQGTPSQITRIGAPPSNPAAHRPDQPPLQRKSAKPAPGKPQRKQAPDRTASKPHPAETDRVASLQAPTASTPSHSDALPNWRSQVVGILERNKRYPAQAEARHEHGVSSLAFTLNRQGRVTSARIAGTSGSAALDAETLALVRRVQPFPPPPPEVAGTQIGLVVAMRYN